MPSMLIAINHLLCTVFSHGGLKRKPESMFEILIQILLSVKQFKTAFAEGGKREEGWGSMVLCLVAATVLEQHREGRAWFLLSIIGNLI